MRRIRKKPVLYIGLFFFLVAVLFWMIYGTDEADLSARLVIEGLKVGTAGPGAAFFCVVPIFFAVFANELPSKSMQCMLGHGITRDKLVMTKLLDALNFVVMYFIADTLFAALMIESVRMEYGISNERIGSVYAFIWITAIRYFGYIVFSAAVFFITNSTAAGVTASLVFVALSGILERVQKASFGHVDYVGYTFDGFINSGLKSLEGGGICWQFLPALLYIVIVYLITVLFYRRKEFEF